MTSLLMLTLTGPSLAYPFRSAGGRGSTWGRDPGLMDYLEGYPLDEQYAVPEYDPNTRYTYAAAPQRPRINKVSLVSLLPWAGYKHQSDL